MPSKNRDSGFTLIELVVVLSIIAIVATFAVPSFVQITRNNQIASVTNALVGLVSFGRQEAVRSRQQVQVVQLNGSWNNGFAVSSGGANVRVFGEMESIEANVTRGGADVSSFAFGASGMTGIAGGAGVTPGDQFVVKLCHSADSSVDGREIVINAGGQVLTNRGVDCT